MFVFRRAKNNRMRQSRASQVCKGYLWPTYEEAKAQNLHPPSKGKKHPTPSNQFTPPQEIREIFLDFFYKFYVSCIYFTKFNWNKSFFKKKFACGGQYCFFDHNNALPPMYLNSISAISSPFSFNILCLFGCTRLGSSERILPELNRKWEIKCIRGNNQR